MARMTPRPTPTTTQTLLPIVRHCPCCGATMWAAYHHSRTLTTREAVVPHVQGVRLNHTIFTWEERLPVVADDIPL